jgi:hypothetical protein
MCRFIRSIVGSLCLSLAFLVPPAFGQGPTYPSGAEGSQKNPAISYAVAILSTMIVMVIVCMPSRKR